MLCCMFQNYRPDAQPFSVDCRKAGTLLAAMPCAVVKESFCCHLVATYLHKLEFVEKFFDSLHSTQFVCFSGCPVAVVSCESPTTMLLLDKLVEGYIKQVLRECNQEVQPTG